MTFTRKDRSAHRAARKTEPALALMAGDQRTDAMRSVVAQTTMGWNSLRHAC